MTETEAKKFIGWLEQRLLKKYPEEAKTELGNDLKKAPVEAARKAAEEIKASGTKFLPSPNESRIFSFKYPVNMVTSLILYL